MIVGLIAVPLLIAIVFNPTPTPFKVVGYTKVAEYPHGALDYSQGFYMESSDVYVESTGLYGVSKL